MVQGNVAEQTVAGLQERFGEAIKEVANFRDETTVVVDAGNLVEIMTYLRDAPELRFQMLSNLTAVDWDLREPRFDVVYHLLSLENLTPLRVKIGVPDTAPVAPSITSVYLGANWYEREVYDMFGITFERHPDLKRILMPDHWDGHPLRKDFPIFGAEPYDQRFGKDEPWKKRP